MASWPELREVLGTIDEKSAAFRDQLHGFWFDFPDVPQIDPCSAAYREFWNATYEKLRGSAYRLENERTACGPEPFPYHTKNAVIVGDQLIAIGNIVRSLNLSPGSRVLEMGAGCGNLSLILARTGYDVTALDIEPSFLALIERRAAAKGVSIRTIEGDYFSASGSYDAVVFYESFHHCHDHVRLLDFVRSRLAPGGVLALCGETVYERIPYPWGLNPWGEAVWQIARNGWFELSFRESYLLDTLRRAGFGVAKTDCPQTAAGNVYLCRPLTARGGSRPASGA